MASSKSVLHTTIITRYEFNTTFFSAVTEFQKNFECLYLKTSIMALEYFFHYSLQILKVPFTLLELEKHKHKYSVEQI